MTWEGWKNPEKIESVSVETIRAQTDALYTRIMGGPGLISCSLGFFYIMRQIELKERALRKARRRRMRDKYLKSRRKA